MVRRVAPFAADADFEQMCDISGWCGETEPVDIAWEGALCVMECGGAEFL